jgi:hypothetical protein
LSQIGEKAGLLRKPSNWPLAATLAAAHAATLIREKVTDLSAKFARSVPMRPDQIRLAGGSAAVSLILP